MTVSVVIPTYRASPFIAETLASIFAQTQLPDEIIVVDDCSPDATVEIVGKIAATAPVPIRINRLIENSGGPAIPIETGVREATGDFLAVLDQDDLFRPSVLERNANILTENPNAEFVFSLSARLDRPTVNLQPATIVQAILRRSEEKNGCRLIPGEWMLGLLITYGNFVVGFPGFFFRRSRIKRGRLLDSRLRIAADYDLLCRLCDDKVAFVNEIQYYRREHETNLCKDRRKMLEELELVQARYRKDRRLRSLGPDGELLYREYLDYAYASRREQRYASAAGWLWAATSVWGVKPSSVAACLKLPAHRLYTWIRPNTAPRENEAV